jgi:hypothetical protein
MKQAWRDNCKRGGDNDSDGESDGMRG